VKVHASAAATIGLLATLAASVLLLRGEAVLTRRVWLPVVMSDNALVVPPRPLRGVLLPKECRACSDIATLNGEWTMDWGLVNPCPASEAEYVPMVWCMPSDLSGLSPDGWLLTANEPDNPAQCGKTPEQIAAEWHKLVATGRKLVSPAVLWSEYATPGYLDENWLDQFMTLVDQDTVEALAIHWNGCNRDVLFAKLDALWAKYHKPIWLSEWMCAYETNPDAFVRPMLQELAQHHVARHAYFAPRACDWYWVPWLLNQDGTVNPLGEAYRRGY
jgi:hypothetical protein